MKPARLRPRAKQDLSDPAVYCAEQGGSALGSRFLEAATAALEPLRRMPGLGSLRLAQACGIPVGAGKANATEELAPEIDAADRAVREAVAKAQAIEDAVYDLKAVNPREKKATDTRTPVQLVEAIAAKGKEVDAALDRLRSLL